MSPVLALGPGPSTPVSEESESHEGEWVFASGGSSLVIRIDERPLVSPRDSLILEDLLEVIERYSFIEVHGRRIAPDIWTNVTDIVTTDDSSYSHVSELSSDSTESAGGVAEHGVLTEVVDAK